MSYKKFSKIILIVFLLFIGMNFLIWEFATKDILTRKSPGIITGDMTRMAYLPRLNYERKNSINLPKKHLNHFEYDANNQIDMITIGDSFSNGNSGGLNRFYQDYLSSDTNLNILNFHQIEGTRNYLETILLLLHSGELKSKGVRYVLVESTQRKVVTRFLAPINLKINTNNTDIIAEHFIKYNNANLKLPKISFINNGNFKYLLYNFLYNFSPNAYISKVYKEKLNKQLFSIKSGDDLLFYKSDLKSISNNTKENIIKVNKNLNDVSELLNQNNIKLIFLPAVAKYDLYRDYLRDKKNYPKDPFFDYFRELKKDYIFIDTKKILSKELKKGIKDIFYIDDTHWSYKASDVISKDIVKQLNSN